MKSQTFKVLLHVYDLSMGMAKSLSPMLIGKQIEAIYHTAVVVYGREYFYGGGICEGTPGRTQYGTPMKVEEIGETVIPKDVFVDFLRNISHKYTQQTYDLIKNNCNNFSNQTCEFLSGNQIPSYILDLPKIALQSPLGKMIEPMLTNLNQSSHLNPNYGQQGFDMSIPIHVPEINPNQSTMGRFQNQGGGSGQNLNLNSILDNFGGYSDNNTYQNTNYNTNNWNNSFNNTNYNNSNTNNTNNFNTFKDQNQNKNVNTSKNKEKENTKSNFLQPKTGKKKNNHKHDNLTDLKITQNQIPFKFPAYRIESIIDKVYSFQIGLTKKEKGYFEEIKKILIKSKKNLVSCQEIISEEILLFIKVLLENKLAEKQMFPVLDLIRIISLLPLSIEHTLRIFAPFFLKYGSELMSKLELLEENKQDSENAQTAVINLMMILRSFANTFQHEKGIKYWIEKSNFNNLIEFLSTSLLLDHHAATENLILASSSLFVNVAMLLYKLKEENSDFNKEHSFTILTSSIILLQRLLEKNTEFTNKDNKSISRIIAGICKVLWRDDSLVDLFLQFGLDLEKIFEKKNSKSFNQVNIAAGELQQILN
ncbi:desumoylating isopeptidase [Anaeramoeba flamelloides]|uniref:Desumoylating isopeptidase n=1 Tax=Anaeramoeba flamelloides TaxID=1746091 RepID=A0AAV7YTQ1_9EUKA|nr:desumoylating isopeptidase [Anaeramoeba flamelloides]